MDRTIPMPRKTTTERWAFTQAELEAPSSCKRDDTFLAFPSTIDEGVYVDRRGISTGQYGDGSFGVTDEDAELADEEDTLHKVLSESAAWGRNLEQTVRWRNVVVDAEGNFVRFKKG